MNRKKLRGAVKSCNQHKEFEGCWAPFSLIEKNMADKAKYLKKSTSFSKTKSSSRSWRSRTFWYMKCWNRTNIMERVRCWKLNAPLINVFLHRSVTLSLFDSSGGQPPAAGGGEPRSGRSSGGGGLPRRYAAWEDPERPGRYCPISAPHAQWSTQPAIPGRVLTPTPPHPQPSWTIFSHFPHCWSVSTKSCTQNHHMLQMCWGGKPKH